MGAALLAALTAGLAGCGSETSTPTRTPWNTVIEKGITVVVITTPTPIRSGREQLRVKVQDTGANREWAGEE
jgi:hypothetical protein